MTVYRLWQLLHLHPHSTSYAERIKESVTVLQETETNVRLWDMTPCRFSTQLCTDVWQDHAASSFTFIF
jgi:hypothetical protein